MAMREQIRCEDPDVVTNELILTHQSLTPARISVLEPLPENNFFTNCRRALNTISLFPKTRYRERFPIHLSEEEALSRDWHAVGGNLLKGMQGIQGLLKNRVEPDEQSR